MPEQLPHLPETAAPAGPRPRPDDSEFNEMIADANSLQDALFTIADKYGAAVTNNEPRWKDGRYLREVGSFIGDVMDAVARFPSPPATDANPHRGASVNASESAVVEISLPDALEDLLDRWDSNSEVDPPQGEAADELRAALLQRAGAGRERVLAVRSEPMEQLIHQWRADRDTTSQGPNRASATQVFDTCIGELVKAAKANPRTANAVWALIPTWLSYRGRSERGEVHGSGFEAYGTCLADLLVALQSTERDTKEGTLPGCTGDDGCPAPAHQHGCLADLDGHCNEPAEHRLIITPSRLHAEFEYRLRTTAAHYRAAGKHNEAVPDNWLVTQIDGAVNTLGGPVGGVEDPFDIETPTAPASVAPPVGPVPPRFTVTHDEVVEAARPLPYGVTYQQVVGFLARLGVQVSHGEADHA